MPIPANTQLPAGDCLTHCTPQKGNKSGRKFNDLNKNGRDDGEPGLPGWEIRVFNSATHSLVDKTTTLADGSYTFTLDPGSYTVCEVRQLGWTQSAPCLAGGPPGTCVGTPIPMGETLADCTPFGADLGPRGYSFTIVSNEPHDKNDFGNFSEECPKFPGLPVDKTFTLDQNNPTQIQDIVDDPGNLDKVILLLPLNGKKSENIIIGQRLKLYGCSITLTAADSSLPVVDITSGANGGLTKDVHATGSLIAGYKIESTKHTIQNTRSFGNAIGFWITGNSNLVTGALGTTNNGIGFKIDGNSNTLDTNNSVETNLGDGVLITGDGNTVKKIQRRQRHQGRGDRQPDRPVGEQGLHECVERLPGPRDQHEADQEHRG